MIDNILEDYPYYKVGEEISRRAFLDKDFFIDYIQNIKCRFASRLVDTIADELNIESYEDSYDKKIFFTRAYLLTRDQFMNALYRAFVEGTRSVSMDFSSPKKEETKPEPKIILLPVGVKRKFKL